MQRDVGPLLAFLGVTEGSPGVCVCTDCSENRLKCFGVLMLMGGGLHFYISYCSELDGVIFLMYIN